MELYGLNTARNGSQIVSESMWQLGMGGGSESYPERPGVPDCAYYMRTGLCGYGKRCRYNHPRDRAAVVASVIATGNYPERPGQLACQFYLKTGTCKFGASCKFDHPKNAAGSLIHVPLNIYGYPLRPGEKECSYYLKTGQCRFGITCKFHHPLPAGSSMSASAAQFFPPVQSPTVTPVPEQYGGAATSLRVARPMYPGSYVPRAYGHLLISPGVVPMTGWSPYSAPISPALSPGAQPTVGVASLYDVSQLSSLSSAIKVSYPPAHSPAGPSRYGQKEQKFPERPGEPHCQYYMRTGDCKFGSSCHYNHPKDRVFQGPNSILSPLGLPLRPGAQPCSFYLQNGHCKFGSTCMFDHPIGPIKYNPSTSSLVDMQAAPYPVRSILRGTLAPSTLELNSRIMSDSSVKDSYSSTRVPSGSNITSSVGLMFPQTGAVSITSDQPPSQSSATVSSSRNTKENEDVHISS
ncbi:hypothetical protein SAY86_019487 [Trapa natans]|uniref:C3H1-type domain-containing protein n=1 Tax=Trapa natans TaxID=22666 RepID=A0AAN7LXL8_TRANT|nr:hypothetical protein SAY86_019487 [Trapa natans]